ncbi:hypothetical protein Tco_1276577 [Tanacetum coccineum]
MSKSTKRAYTLANSIVRNTTGKGSKQATDGPPGFLPIMAYSAKSVKSIQPTLAYYAEKVTKKNFRCIKLVWTSVKAHERFYRRKKEINSLSQSRATGKEGP